MGYTFKTSQIQVISMISAYRVYALHSTSKDMSGKSCCELIKVLIILNCSSKASSLSTSQMHSGNHCICEVDKLFTVVHL